MRIICYCNSAAMVLAAHCRCGLSISCILFVKTLHWFMKRFGYCKERLKESMINLNIKREEKHFGSIQTLPGRVAYSHTSPFLFIYFLFPSLFFLFHNSMQSICENHGETRRQFPTRFLSIPMEIRSIAISSNFYNSCTYLFDPFFLQLLFESSFIVVIIVICIIQRMALWVDG